MRQTHLSRLVTYQRGAESVDIAATLGTTTYQPVEKVLDTHGIFTIDGWEGFRVSWMRISDGFGQTQA
jgi:hypothetical protein